MRERECMRETVCVCKRERGGERRCGRKCRREDESGREIGGG